MRVLTLREGRGCIVDKPRNVHVLKRLLIPRMPMAVEHLGQAILRGNGTGALLLRPFNICHLRITDTPNLADHPSNVTVPNGSLLLFLLGAITWLQYLNQCTPRATKEQVNEPNTERRFYCHKTI